MSVIFICLWLGERCFDFARAIRYALLEFDCVSDKLINSFFVCWMLPCLLPVAESSMSGDNQHVQRG